MIRISCRSTLFDSTTISQYTVPYFYYFSDLAASGRQRASICSWRACLFWQMISRIPWECEIPGRSDCRCPLSASSSGSALGADCQHLAAGSVSFAFRVVTKHFLSGPRSQIPRQPHFQ